MINNATAFILAGGKSSRMGTDKGLMEYNGIPMIKHSIRLLEELFHEVIIIANNPMYKKLGLQVIEDEIENVGPIGGILTGLQNSKTEWNFFIACDLPFMKKELIEILFENTGEFNAIIPSHNGHTEPLCAFYRNNTLDVVLKQIESGNYKLHDLMGKLNTNKVEIPGYFFEKQNPFSNMNTRADLSQSNYK